MMKTPMPLIMMMLLILTLNLLTKKPSIMCLNLMTFTLLASLTMSMKIMLTPIPFIMFLTLIGGLMIIFLYMASSLWTKKEVTTMKTKILFISILIITSSIVMKSYKSIKSTNKMLMFSNNLNYMIIMLMMILVIMLMYTIEIHMKANLPFRRKLKIWE